MWHFVSHFSKRLSDLKQNGTQEMIQFSSTVFNTLSPGGIGFVASDHLSISKQVKPGFTNYQPQPKYSCAFHKIKEDKE